MASMNNPQCCSQHVSQLPQATQQAPQHVNELPDGRHFQLPHYRDALCHAVLIQWLPGQHHWAAYQTASSAASSIKGELEGNILGGMGYKPPPCA